MTAEGFNHSHYHKVLLERVKTDVNRQSLKQVLELRPIWSEQLRELSKKNLPEPLELIK